MSATTANAIATIPQSTIAVPEGAGCEVRRNARGKEIGTRLSFIGAKSASALRQEGKASGLKGKKLDAFVNASLTGDVTAAAWVRHDALLSGMRSAGAVPVQMDGNKAGTQFKTEYRIIPKAPEPKPVVDPRLAIAENLVRNGAFKSVEEAMAAMG